MERIQYFEISILVQLQLSIFKSNHAEVFCNKGLLKISENSQENTCTRVSFLRKLQSSACNFIKQESRTQVFSCEIWETFKKTFLCRTPVVIAFQYCLPIKALWVLSTHKLFYSRNRFSHIFKIYRKRLVARKWVDAYSAAVFQRCSVEIFFKEISQNSQENTCARVPFLLKFQARPKKETLGY